ncbi:hypothetical protein SULI_08525 [Saccharolobus solfataricus]|uniref:Uncharacterized protein n=3 Tax=Saccharolobus solfataricus TaxID=2287 RepID=Q7LXS4_SACS2|nr:hypothetical protein [Saccharolobus solfataricus]AAK40919.1 Conserved hypothetical protein [Saccharolobus solfataricus P2]AKA73949.1 hypothetical protein SULB_1701 [Saccharolobus solfataricus]AKA76646.1 hypothetical protein SULC_1699 [Saccharolobus solfataricus]AKA79340.1 hypothetical protein SULA_1700 [Saccharolobus solfataricus]AZF68426.1 hypothetical protein SULG_08525 [Saccharolobus solfataricus]
MSKFRIDKIPKNEQDIEEIQREIEESHPHEHEHEHSVEELIGEIYLNVQSLQSKVEELNKSNNNCKKEISKIYFILGKLLIALTTNDNDEKIKNLKEVLSLLE